MQIVLYGILEILVALVLIGLAMPRKHSTEESTEIDAHQATVFALVNDFRRFSLWAPWFMPLPVRVSSAPGMMVIPGFRFCQAFRLTI